MSLFFLVAPRFGSTSGFIAMVLPLVTAAKYYAYEARPHGIVLGCAGLAALAWQRVHSSKRKLLWLAVLCLSLTVASLVHVYGITLCMPFALAELVLAFRRRRIDWAVVAVMGVPALAAAPFLIELIKTYRTVVVNSGAIYFAPRFSSVARFYQFLLNPAISVIAISSLIILISRIYDRDRSDTGPAGPGFVDETLMLAVSLLSLRCWRSR